MKTNTHLSDETLRDLRVALNHACSIERTLYRAWLQRSREDDGSDETTAATTDAYRRYNCAAQIHDQLFLFLGEPQQPPKAARH